jgi:hypothetical protein
MFRFDERMPHYKVTIWISDHFFVRASIDFGAKSGKEFNLQGAVSSGESTAVTSIVRSLVGSRWATSFE